MHVCGLGILLPVIPTFCASTFEDLSLHRNSPVPLGHPFPFSLKLYKTLKLPFTPGNAGSHGQPFIASELLQKFPFRDGTLSV